MRPHRSQREFPDRVCGLLLPAGAFGSIRTRIVRARTGRLERYFDAWFGAANCCPPRCTARRLTHSDTSATRCLVAIASATCGNGAPQHSWRIRHRSNSRDRRQRQGKNAAQRKANRNHRWSATAHKTNLRWFLAKNRWTAQLNNFVTRVLEPAHSDRNGSHSQNGVVAVPMWFCSAVDGNSPAKGKIIKFI
jgi:hypothetical protein